MYFQHLKSEIGMHALLSLRLVRCGSGYVTEATHSAVHCRAIVWISLGPTTEQTHRLLDHHLSRSFFQEFAIFRSPPRAPEFIAMPSLAMPMPFPVPCPERSVRGPVCDRAFVFEGVLPIGRDLRDAVLKLECFSP